MKWYTAVISLSWDEFKFLRGMADLIVSVIMVVAVLSGWTMGWVYLLRWRGNRKANTQLAILLLFFSVCVLNNLLVHSGILHPFREKYFVPLWYTLSLGPALYYFIKFTLYPAYEIRWTDSKHFALPVAQGVFYWGVYFSGDDAQAWLWQHFLAPFFKTFEGILYVFFLFTYLTLAYRYIKYKQAVVRRKGQYWEYSKSVWLQWTIKFLFALAVVNTSYIVMDFVVYNFLGWNLYSVKGFSYLGDLSFAAMLFWLVWRSCQYAFGIAYPTSSQLKSFSAENPWAVKASEEGLFSWFTEEKIHLDPELHIRRLAFLSKLQPAVIRKLLREKTGLSFQGFVQKKRLEYFRTCLDDPKFRRQSRKAIGLQAGFFSFPVLQRAISHPMT